MYDSFACAIPSAMGSSGAVRQHISRVIATNNELQCQVCGNLLRIGEEYCPFCRIEQLQPQILSLEKRLMRLREQKIKELEKISVRETS